MSFVDLARALRKRWRAVLLITLIGTGLATTYVVTATPKYTATSQLYVTSLAEASPATQLIGSLTVQGVVPSLVALVDKQPVLEPVVEQLKLPLTWHQLASEVSASAPPSSVLINVSVTDDHALRAQQIANAVDAQYAAYIEQLETPASGPAQVKVSVTQPAVVPVSPSSPNKTLDIAAGLLLGLTGGIAVALLRDATDTTVKSPDDLAGKYDVATLGVVPYERRTNRHPLAFTGSRESLRTEAYRRLRTNLQFVQLESQPRSILVTSPLSDEGKTVTACNLAVALANVGVDVILLECDLRRSKIGKYLDIPSGAPGVTSVLMGWTTWQDALVTRGPEGAKVRVLVAGQHPPNPTELLASQSMERLLTELEEACDVVIVDGPPLLPVSDSALLGASVSGTLVVVRAGRTRERELTRTIESLATVDAKVYGLVLNMTRRDGLEPNYYDRHYSKISRKPLVPDGASPSSRLSRIRGG